MGALRGQEYEAIQRQVLDRLKFWPFAPHLNFTVIPAEKRLLVSNLFGVVRAVYLNLTPA
ncbi:hypothetical protein MPDQ_001726 [Monascus purpureus]|uniref:Uncharacterized protein n=1 Tax=Monascus purpureus TaxID=5098 RepID=A0A507QQM5_MONPU|nr:hypothetical protein MPDQ_001726 [Monascus purpureus]BDD55256.1 hypothetical protein MAP00_000798 [Monascus purpureus]